MSLWAGRGWLLALAAFAALSAGLAGGATATALANPPAPNPADGYAIKLTRPLRAGQKYDFTADATVVQSLTANVSGQVHTLRPRSVSVHFEGTEQILAVNAQGDPIKARYTVTQCVAREGKKEVTVVPPGGVVTVDAGKWKSRMDVDQGGLTIQDELVLRAVLSLPNIDGTSEDDRFGTDKRQKVGESWPVRADAVMRAVVSSANVRVKKQDVSGTVKLAALETVDGVACLRVQGKSRIEHFLPPATDLPENSRVEDSTFEYKFTKLVPADPSGHCMMDSHSVNVLLKLRTDEASIGPDILVDGKLLRTVGIKRRPLR
jgi:hypothetical protein